MAKKIVTVVASNFPCLPGHVQISGRGAGSNLRVAAYRAVNGVLSDQKLRGRHVTEFKMSVVVTDVRQHDGIDK